MTTATIVKPRIRVMPAALDTRGSDLIETAELLGYTLDGWQKLLANDVLATNEDDELAAFEAVALVSRQCGKSLVGELYAMLHALKGEAVMFTAHRADTARLIHRRLLASLPEELGAVPTFTNGKEQITFPSGGVILFRTRGPRVGRGFTLDKLVVDEAQHCTREELEASIPTLRTRPDAQILYLACAPDARTNAYCDVLHDLRRRALAGDSEHLAFVEWSAGCLDGEGNELAGDQLPEAMLDDVKLWRQATPAVESGRITIERMAMEREALDATSFAVEYLSAGVWPQGDGAGSGPVTLEAWDALLDPASELDPDEPIPAIIIGFDMGPDRAVSVVVVGRRADGLLHSDYVGRFEGSNAAVQAVMGIYMRDDVDVRQIVADGEPQNMDLMARLHAEGVAPSTLRTEDAARVGVKACGALVDMVNEAKFRHRGQLELTEALRGAVVKVVTDSWVYSRSRSRGDVAPLLATAVALWAGDLELGLPSTDITIIF